MPPHSMIDRSSLLAVVLSICASWSPVFAAAGGDGEPAAKTVVESRGEARSSHSQTYAVVNGRDIPTSEYETAFASLVRQRFYHGQVPEKDLVSAREEVRNRLVQRIVLLDEAGRRGIVPDAAQIDGTVAGYESRYANSAAWKENRERLLPGLRQQLEEQSLVARLEEQVRQVPDPGDDEVRGFFDARPELFTEPEKIRLSVILLTVDPSSPATTWEATRNEAQAIYKRVSGGADFADAARMHSAAYAETGGDMGYLHRGMLPEILQEQIDKYELGQINPPLETLQGVAIVRLDDRLAPKKKEFSEVGQRARDLLIRERQDQAWKGLIAKLVAAADVKFLHGVSAEQQEAGRK